MGWLAGDRGLEPGPGRRGRRGARRARRDRGGDDGGVGGGWFGYLGYGLGAAIERLPPPPPRPVPLPVASLGFYDHVLRQDPAGAWWFEALDERALPRLARVRAPDRSR